MSPSCLTAMADPSPSCCPHPVRNRSPASSASTVILLIDPDRDLREIVQTGLELTTNWHAIAVPDCQTGIEIITTCTVQAILVNIERLDWDAQLALARLQHHATLANVPTLAIAERVRATELQAARSIGLAGCLSKPLDGVNLGEQIASCLGWQT